jgi:transketolase
MRKAFATTLVALAEKDPRILLLTGDLGYMALEPFSEKFPGRFFNVGVAEQNMVGIATGLAEAGYVPYVYSIASFATLRPYEFIRNGPVHQRLPVRVVGVGGGFDYGTNGPSHHALEDLAVMRAQPGMTVVAPADFEQARAALRATHALPGPVYLRLGKDDSSRVTGLDGRFRLGRVESIGSGGDLVLVTTGSIARNAFAAAEALATRGVDATVIVVASLAPPPADDLAEALERFDAAVTVEAHYVNGGLGSLVCEVVAEHGLACRVVRCGVRELEPGRSGSEAYLNETHGLSVDKLVAACTALVSVPERL